MIEKQNVPPDYFSVPKSDRISFCLPKFWDGLLNNEGHVTSDSEYNWEACAFCVTQLTSSLHPSPFLGVLLGIACVYLCPLVGHKSAQQIPSPSSTLWAVPTTLSILDGHQIKLETYPVSGDFTVSQNSSAIKTVIFSIFCQNRALQNSYPCFTPTSWNKTAHSCTLSYGD